MSHEQQRVRAVDVLRGIAMLGVIAIHARPTETWSLHASLIGRSVPIFLVLVGVSAELWRQKHADLRGPMLAKAYLTATARRLLVPYWAWLICALALAIASGHAPSDFRTWALAPFGYVPWAGPTWFITAIALLSLAIPLLHWLASRIGPLWLAFACLGVTLWSHATALSIMDVGKHLLPLPPGKRHLFLFWIFVPQYFWHTAAGLWLGRRRGRVDAPLFCVSVLMIMWGHWWLAQSGHSQLAINGAFAFVDVPLTFALLGLVQGVARLPGVGTALAYVGRASWGMYLGHILIFAGCEFFGRHYQFREVPTRAAFFGALFAGGLVLTAVGRLLRAQAGRRAPILSSRDSMEAV